MVGIIQRDELVRRVRRFVGDQVNPEQQTRLDGEIRRLRELLEAKLPVAAASLFEKPLTICESDRRRGTETRQTLSTLLNGAWLKWTAGALVVPPRMSWRGALPN